MIRQRTYHVTIRDRESGMVCFESIRVLRAKGKIELNPTPGICCDDPRTPRLTADGVRDAFERLDVRRLRLAKVLWERTFGLDCPASPAPAPAEGRAA